MCRNLHCVHYEKIRPFKPKYNKFSSAVVNESDGVVNTTINKNLKVYVKNLLYSSDRCFINKFSYFKYRYRRS